MRGREKWEGRVLSEGTPAIRKPAQDCSAGQRVASLSKLKLSGSYGRCWSDTHLTQVAQSGKHGAPSLAPGSPPPELRRDAPWPRCCNCLSQKYISGFTGRNCVELTVQRWPRIFSQQGKEALNSYAETRASAGCSTGSRTSEAKSVPKCQDGRVV